MQARNFEACAGHAMIPIPLYSVPATGCMPIITCMGCVKVLADSVLLHAWHHAELGTSYSYSPVNLFVE